MTNWVVVTGASSGIGQAVAERLLKEGTPVVAMARRGNRLRELADRFAGGQVRTYVVDVRDRAAVEAAVREVLTGGDRISCLVNNAGLALGLGPADAGEPDHWHAMIATNVEGLLNCTRAVLPAMRAAQRGHIINIGSLAAQYPFHGGNVYAATKAFVHHLSANLRVDLQDSGIRVTCVAPGMVCTEFALVRFQGDQERANALYEGIEALTPEDVADAVFWAYRTPPRVNVNYVELMPTGQPLGLALGKARHRKERE
jgi:3-hydroxy acid dehydrogenase/malonic semialdehyde reductase